MCVIELPKIVTGRQPLISFPVLHLKRAETGKM